MIKPFRIIAFVLGLAAFLFVVGPSAQASFRDNPPPLTGFKHSPLFTDDSAQGHGVVLSGANVGRSSPVIGEIDGNTANGKEVAVGGSDGVLYVYKSDGTLLWSKNVLPSPCSFPGDSAINSSPSIGQLFGDGVPYVVIGYGTILPSNCDGGVIAYRGSDGNEQWRFSLTTASPGETLKGVVSSPSLADVDGSGKLVVGFGGLDRNVYLLNQNGTKRWKYHAADTVWSSPAFMDINGDGKLEMIIGTDISANPSPGIQTSNGGFVYAFDTAQTGDFGFCNSQVATCTGFIWQKFFDQTIYSSPSIGDVLPSNPGPEIVIGTGCFFSGGGKYIKILRPSDGATLQTLNASACLRSSPALGDITDDGNLKVVATITGATNFGGDGKSYVVAWDPITGNQLWKTAPANANDGSNDPHGDDLQSPVIADLDGNGSLEVIVSNVWSVIILNGKTGAQLTCEGASCGSKLALFAWYTVKSTPAIGDLNGDGVLDVLIGGSHAYNSSHGILYAWTNLAAAGLGSPPGRQVAYSAPWPMFRGDPSRPGLTSPRLQSAPAAINIMHQMSDPSNEQINISIANSGGGSLSWSGTSPAGVTLNPTSGTTPTQTQTTATITTAGRPLGINSLGNIVITATSNASPAAGSPANIPVTLNMVTNLFKNLLPIIFR